MTFRNLLLDELVVGDYPAGPYIVIQPGGGNPTIRFGSGAPGETAPGLIYTDGVSGSLTIIPPTVNLPPITRRLELDGTEIIIGDTILGPDLLDMPGGAWTSTGAQSIPTGVVTTLTRYETVIGRAPVDCSVAAGVFNQTRDGRWRALLSGRFAANATGLRMAYAFDKSSVDQEVGHEFAPALTQPSTFTLYWEDEFFPTDSFRWRVFQNSGGNLNWRTTRASFDWIKAAP